MIELSELKRLRSFMDKAFKFKVNDIVQPKVLGDYANTPTGYSQESHEDCNGHWFEINIRGRDNFRYQIIERWLQECHGGIQKHYRCQVYNNQGGTNGQMMNLTEDELILATPYPRVRGKTKKEMQDWVNSLPEDKK